jgi:hypothetical protein
MVPLNSAAGTPTSAVALLLVVVWFAWQQLEMTHLAAAAYGAVELLPAKVRRLLLLLPGMQPIQQITTVAAV